MKTLLILSLLACLFSCNNKHDSKSSSLLHLNIPIGKIADIRMSDIIPEFKAIKLEYTDQSMIGHPKKVVLFDNRIYILDIFGTKSVTVFNMEGKFIRRIGSNGKGPGQYLLPKDFIIDMEKNEIEIIDNQKINTYSLDNVFKQSHKIDFSSVDYEKLGDTYYFVTGGNDGYYIYETNDNYNIKKKYLHKDIKSAYPGNVYRPLIKKGKDHLLFRSMASDTIFTLNNGDIFPQTFVDFGKHKLNRDEFLSMPFEKQIMILQFKNNANQCILYSYHENDNHIHIAYNMSGKFYDYIYDKQTKKEINFDRETLTDDITWEKGSWYLVGGDDDYFYYLIEPYKYKSTAQLRKFMESFTKDENTIKEMINETSNPIILLAKYKI